MSESKSEINARQRSRRLAMQAIYQWLMADTESSALIDQYLDDDKMEHANADYFRELVLGVMKTIPELEALMDDGLDRPLEQLDPVERAVLTLGSYELLHCPQVPYRVVINEAVELSKTYGATDGHRYINGVMDKLARKTREIEIRARS